MMRIACVQANVVFGDPAINADRVISELEQLRRQNVDLVLFPEAFLTGYCVQTREEALEIAIEARVDEGPLADIRAASDRLGLLVVVGFAERSEETLYNTAALFEPGQPIRFYRKTHLPILGLDRFVEPGSDLPVFETRLGRIGILICFDLRPPEAARVMALHGADLILLPTNWPDAAGFAADFIMPVRAAENRVFFASCNRVGTENGFTFCGKSGIFGVKGEAIVRADEEERTIMADLDLGEARIKRNVTIAGSYETTIFESRQPSLYEDLSSAGS